MSVHDHLNEDGVMVVNMNMRGSKEGNINQYLADTISDVFGEVYTVDVAGSTNRELFASDNAWMLKVFSNNLEMETKPQLIAMMEQVRDQLCVYEAGELVMTDDKAPVELLGMRMIDELIEDEVTYYKNVYREHGLKGLLDNL